MSLCQDGEQRLQRSVCFQKHTFESRKPFPLGTISCNGVEYRSGCIVFQYIVQNPEYQHTMNYQDVQSSLLDNSTIKALTADGLRKVEYTKMTKGGWLGDDA